MTTKSEVGERKAGLLAETLSKLRYGGLAVAEFNEKRHQWVAPGVTLGEFMAELVNGLEVRLVGDCLVNNTDWVEAQKEYNLARAIAQREAEQAMRALNLSVPHVPHQ